MSKRSRRAIEVLDRERAAMAQNARENPAILQRLNEIEAKLNQILALLATR